MATRNPQIQVNGLVPYLGSYIEVKWYYLIPLVAGISGTHLALFMLNIHATKVDSDTPAIRLLCLWVVGLVLEPAQVERSYGNLYLWHCISRIACS